GNKTGYNFEFKEGKLILQPSMLMSYTFVNTFDYTNAAGVRIDNKPLHALQLAPGVKVIGNLKNGWQPYASVSMIWNLIGESDATANGVRLPEMSIKPYVQYGVGVQKRIKDHFIGYGQAMVHNGGRNGVSLTAGFRWALGHDNCKYKVEDKQLRGKAAKSKCHSELTRKSVEYTKRDFLFLLGDSESINANKTLTPTLSVGEGAKNEILRSAQNDRGKYTDNKTSSLDVGGVMPRAAEHKKIIKQMTPSQKAAHGGKYASTTRSAKAGMLRQL
ncbi:autotransporter outer membrane beta-barrel domain-containing protein, partial [bacterium]|nr:autotransporter outer membrane beta-barrel domain-containing protein [bacterium]